MATCAEAIAAIAGQVEVVPEIFPNTAMPIDVIPNESQLYRLNSPQFQSINFNVSLSQGPFGLSMAFYQRQGQTTNYALIGSIQVNQNSAAFPVDFPMGEYIVCIRSRLSTPQRGSFVCRFIAYPQLPELQPRAAQGATAVATLSSPPRPPVECDQPLFYELVDGKLPPGLVLTPLGTIQGVLPNLDCLEDRLSPAAGWYYTENDGGSHPWGREWRFRVKLSIADGSAVPVEDWFCIRIHNNWDFDRENFLAQAPFQYVQELAIVRQPDPIKLIACEPCKPIEQSPIFVPTPIEEPCPACSQDNQSASMELIEIPVELCQVPADEMVAWYDRNKDVVSDCKAVNKFIEDLDNSTGFQLLRSRAGYVPEDPTPQPIKDSTFVAVSSYDKFLQLATVRLDPQSDPNSLSAMIDMWREHENQVLPMRIPNHYGTGMAVSLA